MSGLLLFIAHPDDEIFCSGLLCKLVDENVPVNVVCLTRGEGGQVGSPPIATRETIAEVREAEMHRAIDVLGASSVSFLEYRDPEPDGRQLKVPDHDLGVLTREFADAIDRFQPEVVLTHGSTGDYGHPAHVLVHNTARAAVIERPDLGIYFYSFNAFYRGTKRMGALNRNDWATFLFDSTPYLDRRLASFWEHKTQYGVFVGNQDSDEAYRSALSTYFQSAATESYHRHLPRRVSSATDDPLIKWTGVSLIAQSGLSTILVKGAYRFAAGRREVAKKVKKVVVR